MHETYLNQIYIIDFIFIFTKITLKSPLLPAHSKVWFIIYNYCYVRLFVLHENIVNEQFIKTILSSQIFK